MDERSSYPTIAVGEGVDRLELGVHERGLDERGVGSAVEVCHEVVQQCWRQFGRWRDEVCL